MANPGERIGPYEIVGLLGRGGMGEVYRARDTRLAGRGAQAPAAGVRLRSCRDVPGQVLRVAVRRTPSLTLGAPQLVPRPSNLIARAGFDVSLDGTRLLMVQEVKTDEQRAASLAVVQNWFAAFRK